MEGSKTWNHQLTAPMHEQIYVTINGEPFGPYTEEEFRLYIAEEKIQISDLAWHEGLPDWITVDQLLDANPWNPATPKQSDAVAVSEKKPTDKSLSEVLATASDEDRAFYENNRTAALNGDAIAQHNLANLYFVGDTVSKNVRKAVKWYRKAAEQGHLPAQRALGHAYCFGDGVEKDDEEAIKWFYKAASAGYAPAQSSLGCMHSQWGAGIEAANWFLRAATQGDKHAQYFLGQAYKDGFGVPQDYVEAYKWFNLSAADGYEEAAEDRATLTVEMTREQIALGQHLAAIFVPCIETENATGEVLQPSEDSFAGRKSSGTGFFISDDGFLVTNEHVVRDATQIRLVTSTGLISARVVKLDAANDLALLKAEGRFAALPVAVSRWVKLGATVGTLGFPNIGLQGFAPKLAKGEIASLSGVQDDAREFQISVPVQPGNSGGALVDERGNVVGVVSAKLSASAALVASGALPENVNYAVKSSFLLGFLESVPEVSAKLKEPETKERKFEDVVKSAEQAAVLVLVY
jgi:S1-C subfamily serine protease